MRILMTLRPTAQPGDVFLYNDPYGSGGQHLPDFYIVKPIFHEGVIEGWACTMAHHCDVGGIAPGSSPSTRPRFSRKACLPVVKLYEAGKPNETLLRILEKNTRMPVQLIGDVRAQLAACAVGERGYRARSRVWRGRPAPLSRRDAGSGRADDARRDRGHPGRRYTRSKTGSTASANIRSRCASPSRWSRATSITIDFTGTSPQVEASGELPDRDGESRPPIARSAA